MEQDIPPTISIPVSLVWRLLTRCCSVGVGFELQDLDSSNALNLFPGPDAGSTLRRLSPESHFFHCACKGKPFKQLVVLVLSAVLHTTV